MDQQAGRFAEAVRGMTLSAVCLLAVCLVASSNAHAGATYTRKALKCLIGKGGRVDWSPRGGWIAYDRQEGDGFYDIYRIRPDGSGNYCLTCDHPDLPNKHQGQPAQHPDGGSLVFQAEMSDHPGPSFVSHPGLGAYCHLWLIDLEETANVYRLTTEEDVNPGIPAGGSLHPHFSHDGSRLLWSRRTGSGGSFGDWELVTADVEWGSSYPYLKNRMYYNPGDRTFFYEAQDWSLDDSGVYFAGSLIDGQHDFAMDVYHLDLATQKVTRLTRSSGVNNEPAEWDEHAKVSPSGDVIVFDSSAPYGIQTEDPDTADWLKLDLWLMNLDGSGLRRITFFNEPGHEEYDPGRVRVADFSWSPDGKKIVLLALRSNGGPPAITTEEVWLLEFELDGDFDADSDVDGSDLSVLASDFGRSDCAVKRPCTGDI